MESGPDEEIVVRNCLHKLFGLKVNATRNGHLFFFVHKTIRKTIDRITSDPFLFTPAFVHTSVMLLSLFRVSTGAGETWLGSFAECVKRQM